MPITATIWHSDELVYNGQCHCCNFPPSGLPLPAASVSHAALHLTTFQMNIWHQYAANLNTPLNSWELIQNTLDRIIFPLQLRGLDAFFPESTGNRKSICFTFKFFLTEFLYSEDLRKNGIGANCFHSRDKINPKLKCIYSDGKLIQVPAPCRIYERKEAHLGI